MNNLPLGHSKNTVSTNNNSRRSAYIVVTIISGASGFVSFFLAFWSINATVIYLSICTSIVCFACALILAMYRRDALAFLLSFAIAPIFLGLAFLYFETRPLQIKVVEKVSEISRKIKDPQPALDRAIQNGSIRKATAEDVRAFRDAYLENKYHSKSQQVLDSDDALSVTKVDISHAYVVLKKFTYPSGVVNEYKVVFFIPKGVPEPNGEIGQSAFYDFGTLTVGCTVARTGGFSC